MTISTITQALFLGNRRDAEDLQSLKANGITHIVQAMPPTQFQSPYPDDFVYHIVNVEDSSFENLGWYFGQIVEWVDDAIKNGGKVFVHCMAGMSRSASLVIAYIMYSQSLSLDDAYKFVKE